MVRSLFSAIKIEDRSSAIGLRKTLERPTTANGYYGEMVCCFLQSCINPFLLLHTGPSCGSSIQQHGARA